MGYGVDEVAGPVMQAGGGRRSRLVWVCQVEVFVETPALRVSTISP